MTTTTQKEIETEVRVSPDGSARVILGERLDAVTAAACWPLLEKNLRTAGIKTLEVDGSRVQFCNGAGLALMRYLNMGRMTPSAKVSIVGLDPELEKNFLDFTLADYEAFRPPPSRRKEPLPEEVGDAVARANTDLHAQVGFVGDMVANLTPTIMNSRRMRWPEVLRVVEVAGANAGPIVSLISLLVGLIIAFESAQPLAQFGAQIFVANMIGLVMVRELGPLLAAILLAGRSGSAFAAEIGTMKVNEELNALETLGLDPIRFLVIQRVIAGIFLTPLLTFYAVFMGILGGVLVMLGLGFPLTLIYHQLAAAVNFDDVALAAAKGVVFGAIVSGVGCLRGLQTKEGPSAVGVSTTRAVVTSILLIVIADAVFSVVFYMLTK